MLAVRLRCFIQLSIVDKDSHSPAFCAFHAPNQHVGMAASTHEPYKLTRDLWAEALKSLPEDDQKLVTIPSPPPTASGSANGAGTDSGKPALAVLREVEAQKTKCQDKRWSFLFRGKKVVVRDLLDKITGWIQKFQDVADWIVSLDVSGHASMPWACVKFFLEVRTIPDLAVLMTLMICVDCRQRF